MSFNSDRLLNRKNIALIILGLIVLTLATKYYGSTDLPDYSDTAKYFAHIYPADIRSSHSYLYGFIHYPFVALLHNFVIFKITSLAVLLLLVYSIYYISHRDKRTLVLLLLSPVVWYMAPWISPIQLASLCLLWAYFFIEKYESTNKLIYGLYSGACVGLGLAFWDTIFFFGAFLIIAYMYNKKFWHLALVCVAILVGLMPRLMLDYYLFNFPFFSLLKSIMGTFTNALFLGRGTTYATSKFSNVIFFILIIATIPYYFWRLIFKQSFIKSHKKLIIFISLSTLLILINPQIRYTLAIVPIITLVLSAHLSEQSWRKQIKISACIALIFIIPYLIQLHYSINQSEYYDITESITNFPNFAVTSYSESNVLKDDLAQLEKDYPNQVFLVIGHSDYYQKLAHLYWGNSIKELVSIQDYELWQKNESSIFEKRLVFMPRINDRRSIWIGGGIMRNTLDKTDYASIEYALALNSTTTQEGFSPDNHYTQIYVLKKDKS